MNEPKLGYICPVGHTVLTLLGPTTRNNRDRNWIYLIDLLYLLLQRNLMFEPYLLIKINNI